MYRLVALNSADLVPDTTFETAEAAMEYARSIGLKARPQIVVDDSWKDRERKRFQNDEYETLPWQWDGWFMARHSELFHFAHVSTKDPTQIAYTESPEKGMADRQTAIAPGRYLERYFSDALSAEQIRDLARAYVTRLETPPLQIVRLSTDIVSVYREGPDSCMSKSLDCYASRIHPVMVYGYEAEEPIGENDSHLVLAYIRSGDRITGRALVNERDKKYMRLYGDMNQMRKSLNAAGFFSADGPFGYTIRKIPHRDGYVMPYIDAGDSSSSGGASVEYAKDDRFEIVENGEGSFEANGTNGLTYEVEEDEDDEEGTYCEYYCEDRYEESYRVFTAHGAEWWCESARDEHATLIHDIYYADDIVSVDGNGRNFVLTAETHGHCSQTNQYWPNDEMHVCSVNGSAYHESLMIQALNKWGETRWIHRMLAPIRTFRCRFDGQIWLDEAMHLEFEEVARIHTPNQETIRRLSLKAREAVAA